MRIAVLGANGQVGAEVCLLLRNLPDVTVIPICRNRLGSAFLRYQGLPVRHGKAADETEAPALLGDCDAVVNLALGAGSLRDAADQNRRLIRSSIEYSPARARVIYCSSLTVHGDPTPGRRVRIRGSYAREKLRGEQQALRMGRAADTDVFVLRLGHVMGELQGVTALLRQQVAAGPVYVPDPQRPSNTVHCATIVDAIVKTARGLELPGTYDLVNQPQWTWQQVYEREARQIGQPLRLEGLDLNGQAPTRSSAAFAPRRMVSSMIRTLTASPTRKEMAMRMIARLSPAVNQRIQARYYQNRAAAEIAALERREVGNEAALWRGLGDRFLQSLAPTVELLDDERFRLPVWDAGRAWPPDLALYGA